MSLLTGAGRLLLTHPELVKDIVDLIDGGADPEEIKKAVRDLKKTVAERILKDEMGLP